MAASAAPRGGAWIWGRRVDLLVFGGSAAVALTLAALAPFLASDGGGLPAWGFLLFVVAIDVAHVHATIFRTYLDVDELDRRPLLYLGVPLACYAAGVALHLSSALTFWRVLAYVAVAHFVRQQTGWVAIYRARAGDRGRAGRVLDDAVIYFATGWPLLYWHTHLPRAFAWFVPGDFVEPPAWLASLVAPLGAVYAALLVAYVARAVAQGAPLQAGKHVVVATTVVTWLWGIVLTDGDFTFTVTNVITHGVPYLALLWAYARERGRDAPRSLVGRIAAVGFSGFLGVALALAFVEEVLWDRVLWHEHTGLFGGDPDAEALVGATMTSLLVPLLALPQATHYVLDAVLWRRGATGPAQARALGFGAPRGAATADDDP